jgi:Cyanobacterial TRADD-N associated 2-Transmembrane domain
VTGVRDETSEPVGKPVPSGTMASCRKARESLGMDDEKQTSAGMVTVDEIQKLRTEQARQRRLYMRAAAVVFSPMVVFSFALIFLEDVEWARPLLNAYFRYFKWLFALYAIGFVALVPMMRRQISIQRQLEDARLGIVQIASELPDDLESKLISLNLKYQDRYYLETGLQANKSFYASLMVAILGFIMVCTAIVLFFYEKITAAYVTVAAGAITEFISAVFFYLFNKTILSMASYHQRLLFTQNIALSLKLVHSLPEDKRLPLIERIVAELTRDLNLYLGGQTVRDKPNDQV